MNTGYPLLKTLLAIVVAALATAVIGAVPVDQCVREHYSRAKQYPDIPYEKDRNIVRIWCTCMYEQESAGKPTSPAVKTCTSATNEPINRYLRTR